MNTIALTGRITADVQLKSTPQGVYVCTFCIAVKRPHTSDKTDFINCVAWRNTAEFISRYFSKGKMIAVNGILTSRNYEDKDGNKHTVYEVIVDNAEFCGDKNSAEKQTSETAPITQNAPQQGFEEISDSDELPF